MIQLEFFVNDETVRMKEEIKKLKSSNERVRKSMFAKHGELYKNYSELSERLEILERNICQGSVHTLKNGSISMNEKSLLDFVGKS